MGVYILLFIACVGAAILVLILVRKMTGAGSGQVMTARPGRRNTRTVPHEQGMRGRSLSSRGQGAQASANRRSWGW